MNIKHFTYRILTLVIIVSLAACSDEDKARLDNMECVEMTGINAQMTRAVQVADLEDYVGKKEFDNADRAVFVTIKRKMNAIPQFTYSDIEFICAASTSAEGVTSIGWSRDKNTGTTGGSSTEAHPDRIYWSDATNPHTFIGFCAPQQGDGQKAFDWKKENGVFYGSIGDPTAYSADENNSNHLIDFRSTFDAEGHETVSGNVELCKNDILLTYSTEVTAQDAIAKLYFHHGLAQVRVVVNISDFAAGGGDDTKSTVSDMILKNMLTMYKWQQDSVATKVLESGDQEALNDIYGSTNTPLYDQRKDFNLWIPNPSGIGENSSRTFTFYGMVVPTEILESNPLAFSFKVTYPNPMDPSEMKDHTYKSSIKNIRFDAGKCTTISISLNHRNEKMTIGAEYDDWEFIATPDQGELKKNSTFLTTTARKTGTDRNAPGVTIGGDPLATEDDATWLYLSGSEVLDVYGNNGTKEKPYTISTADQLLSFAYEVQDGRTFEDKYVKLDADIVLQPNLDVLRDETGFYTLNSEGDRVDAVGVTWPGIGTFGATQEDSKVFNGTFLAGNRIVKRLFGSPFFVNIGPKGRIDALLLEEVLGVTSGGGALASLNQGVICASTVTSVKFGSFNIEKKDEMIMVKSGENYNSVESSVAGPLVGRNEGLVFSCHSQGTFTTDAARVGGLVGYNTGALVVSYAATKETTSSSASERIYRGIVGYNDYKKYYSSTERQDNEFGTITYCFFDKTIANNVGEESSLQEVHPKTTIEMKKSDFIGDNDRYSKLTEREKAILSTLETHERAGATLTDEEQALKEKLLRTLNGNIAYFAYHSSLCPKVIRDAYHDGADDQMQVLVIHFLNHYYAFRVGDYPQVY